VMNRIFVLDNAALLEDYMNTPPGTYRGQR
jgi:hypothetical protein